MDSSTSIFWQDGNLCRLKYRQIAYPSVLNTVATSAAPKAKVKSPKQHRPVLKRQRSQSVSNVPEEVDGAEGSWLRCPSLQGFPCLSQAWTQVYTTSVVGRVGVGEETISRPVGGST